MEQLEQGGCQDCPQLLDLEQVGYVEKWTLMAVPTR